MKVLVLILFIALPLISSAQPLPANTEAAFFEPNGNCRPDANGNTTCGRDAAPGNINQNTTVYGVPVNDQTPSRRLIDQPKKAQ